MKPIVTKPKNWVLFSVSRKMGEEPPKVHLVGGGSNRTKNMVVSAMIRRVEVSRDYELKIYFNFNLDQCLCGLDCGGAIQAGGVNMRSACKDKNGNHE